jgi:hypothetical protein
MLKMKRYIQHFEPVDLGFVVKKYFPVDIDKLREWFHNLENDYNDWKFIIGENHHVWNEPIVDMTGQTGHILPDDVYYYTLCYNGDVEGPLPFERGCAKPEYHDIDEDLLYPRKCFNGYALDLIQNMPVRSKRWLVTVHTPGTKLITHTDSPDKIRVHIPIYTNDDSNWIIDGVEYHMEPGYAYLVNTTLPHSVENRGTTNRIHLYGKVWTEDFL